MPYQALDYVFISLYTIYRLSKFLVSIVPTSISMPNLVIAFLCNMRLKFSQCIKLISATWVTFAFYRHLHAENPQQSVQIYSSINSKYMITTNYYLVSENSTDAQT